MNLPKDKLGFVLLRIGIGWVFLWSFIDKVFGFGFNTTYGKSWLNGVSPTFGFLKFAVKGPFVNFFHSLAGNQIVDWLFMLGLLFIGLALILGIMVRLGGYTGILMLFLMYIAGFIPPEHNPFLDEHIIYIFALIGIINSDSGNYLGLGKWWSRTEIAQKYKMFS